MRSAKLSFTDLVVALAALMVAACLMLMQIQRHRAAARRSGCVNNLSSLALAIHNYHSAYRKLPMGCGGTSAAANSEPWQNNQGRLSAWVGLLPFLEEQALWEEIANPQQGDGILFPAMGPVPWFDAEAYSPWANRPDRLACPDDPNAKKHSVVSSYVLNYGDAVHRVGSPQDPDDVANAATIQASNRGIFFGGHEIKFRDCLDGLSNTLMFSEATIASKLVAKGVDGLSLDPSLCITAHEDPDTHFWPPGRAACWADGSLRSSGFQTILPPNSPSATSVDSDLEGIVSASSHHVGGVNVAFGDGSVRFVVDTIRAGNNNAPTVALLPGGKHAPPKSKSPFGLWGALGTRACMEVIGVREDDIRVPMLRLTDEEEMAIRRRPVQKWRVSNGESEIQGQMVAVHHRTLFYLPAPDGPMKQIPLQELAGEDAERATQQYDRVLDRVALRLKAQVTQAIELLDEKQFDAFCKNMIQSQSRNQEQMVALVRENRGFLVQTLENLKRELADPNSRFVYRRMTEHAPIKIRLPTPGQSTIGDIKLAYRNDKRFILTD